MIYLTCEYSELPKKIKNSSITVEIADKQPNWSGAWYGQEKGTNDHSGYQSPAKKFATLAQQSNQPAAFLGQNLWTHFTS